MKNTILLIITLFTSVLAFAQSKNRNVTYADKFFKIQDYYLATEYYEKALKGGENTDYVHYQLGECDRLFYQYEKAEEHYKHVVDHGNNDFPLARYYYAVMLKTNAKYDSSVTEFSSFLSNYKIEDKYRESAKLEKEGALYILDEQTKTLRNYNFENLGGQVNSNESDFAPTIYTNDSTIVFASARFNKKYEDVYGRLGGAFLDNYMFEKRSDSNWVKINNRSHFDRLNTEHHDGAGTFTNDNKAYYFTRCDEKGSNKQEYHCAIYVSELKEGDWQEAIKLNETVNEKDSWNAHPTLSSTGDTLFFASKRDGGIGETDVWYSIKSGTSLSTGWGEAINIGEPINTKYIDMSPQYIKDHDVLLFSSNGHIGFGGLDVYVASGDQYKEIRNLGLPFNSNHDDFHMVLGDSTGYVSSNREGGIGSDDIYSFDVYSTSAHLAGLEKSEDKRYDHVDMYGEISTRGNADLEGVNIVVKDMSNEVIKSVETNDKGQFSINDIDLQDDKEIVIDLPEVHLLSEDNYVVDSLSFVIKSSIVQVGSKDTSSIDIAGVVLDENGNPKSGVRVGLLDENGKELMHTLSNEFGEFMFRSLDGSKEYTLKIDNDAYSISNVQLDKNKEKVNTASLEDANSGLSSRIKAESIYYDFNSSEIREEAKKALSEIHKTLTKYPNVTLELHGYTDSKGTSAYNIALGESRGNAALKYLENLGVDQSRIQVKTHGETKPIASNNTFEGRQLNRRVDFYILGGAKYEQKAQVHIMKPGATLNDVAKEYNMSLSELKELNNISTNSVSAYAPIRVKVSGDEVSSVRNIPVSVPMSSVGESNVPEVGNDKFIIKNDSYHDHVKYLKEAESGYYLVLPKNTLYTISKICGVHIDKLKSLNHLESGSILAGQVLQVSDSPSISKESYLASRQHMITDLGITVSDHEGQVFELDGFSRYVVKKGDTLFSIGEKHGVKASKIKELNNLTSDAIRSKMVLKLRKL